MKDYKASSRFKLEQRNTTAAEVQAEQAIRQSEIAREQSETAIRADSKARWTLVVAAIGLVVAIAVPFASIEYGEASKSHRTFESQLKSELATATELKAALLGLPEYSRLKPGQSLRDVRSAASDLFNRLVRAETVENSRELVQDRDQALSDIYFARREAFSSFYKAILGAEMEAAYRTDHPTGPGTVQGVLGYANATMIYNRYVAAIEQAAKSHGIKMPADLWIINRDFQGPTIEDHLPSDVNQLRALIEL